MHKLDIKQQLFTYHIYIYIYLCVCVCVCVNQENNFINAKMPISFLRSLFQIQIFRNVFILKYICNCLSVLKTFKEAAPKCFIYVFLSPRYSTQTRCKTKFATFFFLNNSLTFVTNFQFIKCFKISLMPIEHFALRFRFFWSDGVNISILPI